MKKFFLLILLVAMNFLMSGCGTPNNSFLRNPFNLDSIKCNIDDSKLYVVNTQNINNTKKVFIKNIVDNRNFIIGTPDNKGGYPDQSIQRMPERFIGRKPNIIGRIDDNRPLEITNKTINDLLHTVLVDSFNTNGYTVVSDISQSNLVIDIDINRFWTYRDMKGHALNAIFGARLPFKQNIAFNINTNNNNLSIDITGQIDVAWVGDITITNLTKETMKILYNKLCQEISSKF